MAERPPFPSYIDASMIRTFRECPRKFELEYLQHWKTKTPSVHLHAGGAFAKGLEETRRAYFENSASAESAIARGAGALLKFYGNFECPPESAKSPGRMVGALEYYFTEAFGLETDAARPISWGDGRSGIEFSFANPLPFDHPTSGEPLIYVGRSDMVCEFNGGTFIEDDKTATSLGASWSSQWDLRSQFTGYSWAARQSGLAVDGILIRGVSILKTKYDHAQVLTYRRTWEIDRWLAQTLRDLSRMEEMWEAGYFDYNLDESCNSYGGCLFRRVCLSEDPTPWLRADYGRRIWNPLSHTETLLDLDGNPVQSASEQG